VDFLFRVEGPALAALDEAAPPFGRVLALEDAGQEREYEQSRARSGAKVVSFAIGGAARGENPAPAEGRFRRARMVYVKTSRGRKGTVVHFISLVAVLFGAWLLLSGHFEPLLIALGLASSIIVALITLRMELVDQEGHPELSFTEVRVPVDHILVGEGEGFAIAQGRLGPGRVHHCMRAIGQAERALSLMTARAAERVTFGDPLLERQIVREWIARSRIEIEQARLLVLKAAWMIDRVGPKEARQEIAMIKVVAPAVALSVIDRAIQAFGAAGVSQDTPLAESFAHARTLRIVDGPDEVHLMTVAKEEIRRQMASP
jgi:hypothetical protein